ncbi:hypothetical protein V491_04025 [Pseudogymnoascus sp. VKM F-3775]|nr:hypothetical protein V491_04025 [Pseudogymnoascus sp. VKM F-3775]
MTSISDTLKARARKAEKEQSDKEKAFKKLLDEVHYNHDESLQAQQDQYDAELAELLKFKKELVRDYDRLTVKYHTACAQVEDQNEKINDLDAKLSEYTEVLDHIKAPDGPIYIHNQRQDIVKDLKRDAN